MSPSAPAQAAQQLSEVNTRLDQLERRLDQIEDLLEQLWDAAVEPARAEEERGSPGE